jgi:hypothetical protein
LKSFVTISVVCALHYALDVTQLIRYNDPNTAGSVKKSTMVLKEYTAIDVQDKPVISIRGMVTKMKHDFYIEREYIIDTLKLKYGSDNFDNMFVVYEGMDSNPNISEPNVVRRLRTLFDGPPKFLTKQQANDEDNIYNANTRMQQPKRTIYNDKYMSSLQSYNRMVQKAMKKILQAKIDSTMTNKEKTPGQEDATTSFQQAGEDRIQTEGKANIKDQNTTDNIEALSSLVPFVWVTAGNSVGAGHGNLHNETYSAVVECNLHSMLQNVFNLNLIVRNYGISAMVSAPEGALCLNEVYGTDIDLLIWHFSLTDGSKIENLVLFLYRALLHRNHPAVWAFQVDGNIHARARRQAIQELDTEYGLTVLAMNDTVVDNVLRAVPDSFGLSDEDINALPEYLRNFRCEKGVESGEPYCTIQRFSNHTCNKRVYRVSWHPGW